MSLRKNLSSINLRRSALFIPACGFVIAILLSLVSAPSVVSQGKVGATSKQRTFDTPQQAAEALVEAAEKFDIAELEAIFGPAGHDLIISGEPAHDEEMARAFAAEARVRMNISIDPRNSNHAILTIGNDNWPAPVPLVKSDGKWFFDAKAGRRELLYRRIGRNELDAIEICRGFVEAQKEYARQKHDGSAVNQYAQRVISTPGKRD
ncbi:MAG: DUF2950 family protein, partial [Blastocatellia bacterium]|nr:DUF2950 family protein [Blastocatellia bacterium]